MKYRFQIRDTDLGLASGSTAEGTWTNKETEIKALALKYKRARVKVEAFVCNDMAVDLTGTAYVLYGDIGQIDKFPVIAVCPRANGSTGTVDFLHIANFAMSEQIYDVDLSRFSQTSIKMRLVGHNLSALADNIIAWMVILSIEPYEL